MNGRILPTLALLSAAGIFIAYVNPAWSGPIRTMKESIASDDRALAAANAYARQQNQLAAARNAIDPADLKRLDTLLPDSIGNVGLILDLDALAARSGLSLSNVDVLSNIGGGTVGKAASAAVNPVGSVDLSVSAIGTYAALKMFLTGVERSQRLLDVKELTIRGSDTGVYNYQLKLSFYWLRS